MATGGHKPEQPRTRWAWLGFSGHRQWVYPHSVRGRFQKVHRVSSVLLHLLLVVPPLLTWKGLPLFRVDLPDRRVYVPGAVFTATDGLLLVLIGLLAAFALFFFTSLYGRLWCGYACPQTVFLEEWIRPIEKWFEGERSQRLHRDRGPWTFDRAWRKAGKWAAFALVAFLVSMAFMSWFAGPAIWIGQGGPVEYALVGIFTVGWFLDFAWFREQLCNYVCPYARFQGALADDESLVVSYDRARGEPRGKAAKATGGCIDCHKCVVVCPQGIDIREGYQLECITCARCVDACEAVMGKLGHPTLVRYATIAEEEGCKPRLIRPRTVLYAGLLFAVSAAILAVLVLHQPMEATVVRSPGSTYTVDADGMVRNTYLLRVANNGTEPMRFRVEVEDLPYAELVLPELVLLPGERRNVPLVVRVPPGHEVRSTPMRLRITSEGGELVRVATFLSPGRKGT